MPADRIENFLEDRSYYFTLRDDAGLLRRVAEMRGDTHIVSMLDTFLLRLRAIADVTLAYWRHGQSGSRTDIAWAMGFLEEERDLDSFLAELGFTDRDLREKPLSQLAHMNPVTGILAEQIEASRENYTVFLQSLSISFRNSRSMT